MSMMSSKTTFLPGLYRTNLTTRETPARPSCFATECAFEFLNLECGEAGTRGKLHDGRLRWVKRNLENRELEKDI